MTAKKDYLFNTALDTTATITAIDRSHDRISIKLDLTNFHPQGGGQKADLGTIAGVRVIHVAHDEGDISHYVESAEGLTIGQTVSLNVDPEWRLLNSKLHTAGHLIAALIEREFPNIQPSAAHHWLGEARVEFTGDNLASPDKITDYLNSALCRSIVDNLPINFGGDFQSLRTIQIGLFAAVPCGGTHLQQLGQLEQICLTGVKIKKGKLRISYEVK